jgi:hypothetical protein
MSVAIHKANATWPLRPKLQRNPMVIPIAVAIHNAGLRE